MISFVKGDILDSQEQYLCQQCNCISVRSHGLSQQIASRYPHANPYALRSQLGRRNHCIKDHIAVPGTIDVLGTGDQRRVICMYAQYGMGKPGSYGSTISDSHHEREQWFISCLRKIGDLHPESIALPYRIGCGLAGGDWDRYLNIIKDWSSDNPSIKIVIYQI